MQNLKSLSDSLLLEKTKTLVQEERKLTTSILWHLREIEARMLYAKEGYASLFDYARRALSYSEGAAGRRIAAMRLLVEVPEAEEKLENGELSLSTLCTLQSFFTRKEEPVTREEKAALVLEMQGKSRRECEKALVAIDPVAATPPAESKTAPASNAVNPRYVPAHLKREVWKRDQGACSYVSDDGRRCGSRFAVQTDHVVPIARGGRTEVANLRLLCRVHNREQAIAKLGIEAMRPFLRGTGREGFWRTR